MKRRKLAKLITIFIMFGLLTGCGASSGTPDDYATNEGYTSTEGTATSTNTTTGSSGISKDSIKVGVLYISDPSEGSGYSYTHDLGIQGMQENLGLDSDQIVRKIVDDGDAAATETAIKDCISEGCNIIFTTSWGYMETTAALAEQYPDVAAQDSSNSEVTGGIDAFAIGVESVNSDAQIYVVVTNSWYDPDKEKAASEKLLDMGCDVMTQHCDTAYPQTLAQERGVYGIGYNSDMSKETPDSCLTSVIWNWSAYYTSAVKSIINGTWDGSNYYGGMAEGLVGITNLASFAADGTQEKVDEATAAILSGQNNVFDGVLKTNTGETIGAENQTLDDATITGGINWYYHNVNIVE